MGLWRGIQMSWPHDCSNIDIVGSGEHIKGDRSAHGLVLLTPKVPSSQSRLVVIVGMFSPSLATTMMLWV